MRFPRCGYLTVWSRQRLAERQRCGAGRRTMRAPGPNRGQGVPSLRSSRAALDVLDSPRPAGAASTGLRQDDRPPPGQRRGGECSDGLRATSDNHQVGTVASTTDTRRRSQLVDDICRLALVKAVQRYRPGAGCGFPPTPPPPARQGTHHRRTRRRPRRLRFVDDLTQSEIGELIGVSMRFHRGALGKAGVHVRPHGRRNPLHAKERNA
jgi:hypothetical protein